MILKQISEPLPPSWLFCHSASIRNSMCHNRHCGVSPLSLEMSFPTLLVEIFQILREKLSITAPFSGPQLMKILSVKSRKQFLGAVVTIQVYSSLLSVTVPPRPPWAEVTLRIWVDYRCIIKCRVKKTDLQPHSQLYPFTYSSMLKS